MSITLLEVSIPPGAYVAEPLSPAEIDAHPDADRIWRTIKEVREAAAYGAYSHARLPLDFDRK